MLEIKNLTKKFDDKILFENLSYSFPDTGLYLISGESGIGKTTLLRIIAGLDSDFDGSITGGGIGRASVCFQEYRLFPSLNAIDNIIFAISDRKDEAVLLKVKNMLFKMSFDERDFSLKPSELSGGMKQRISLARAFLFDAPILLLDEPTKELDVANCEIIRQIISEQSKKRLVILVSHSEDDLNLPGAVHIHL